MKGERGVEFVSVKKNPSLQHKLCITCEVSRGFVPDCSPGLTRLFPKPQKNGELEAQPSNTLASRGVNVRIHEGYTMAWDNGSTFNNYVATTGTST